MPTIGGKEILIMSSYCYGGSVRMNPELEEAERDPMFDGGYPYSIPKVFLEGNGEVYNRQWCFNWDNQLLIMSNIFEKYTIFNFKMTAELVRVNKVG